MRYSHLGSRKKNVREKDLFRFTPYLASPVKSESFGRKYKVPFVPEALRGNIFKVNMSLVHYSAAKADGMLRGSMKESPETRYFGREMGHARHVRCRDGAK